MAFTANLKSKLHIFYDSGDGDDPATYTNNADVVKDYATAAGTGAVGAATASTDTYTLQYYVAWANPDTSSSVTYDGVQGRVIATVSSEGRTNNATNPPTISAIWEDRAVTSEKFDMRPVTQYDSSTGA